MFYPGPHSVREVHEVTTGLSPFPAPQPPPSHHVHPALPRATHWLWTPDSPPSHIHRAAQAARWCRREERRSGTRITAMRIALMPVDPAAFVYRPYVCSTCTEHISVRRRGFRYHIGHQLGWRAQQEANYFDVRPQISERRQP